MRAFLLFALASVAPVFLAAQDNVILVFDPVTEQVDTIQPVAVDDTISGFLPHGTGTLSGWTALDNAAFPEGFAGTQMERPPRASAYVDLSAFPVRTACALRRIDGDSSWTRCSAQLVGPWYALTASHCVRNMDGTWRTGRIDVAPVFDNGTTSAFGPVRAVRYYVPLQPERDCTLLELEEPIGATVGWLGLGFSTEPDYFDDKIIHKFCYPADTSFIDPALIYNGDTLYHFAAPMIRMSQQSTQFVGVPGWSGVPGESGSGVWVTDNSDYHVLGVATWSANYRHTVMDAGTFEQFRLILQNGVQNVNDMRAEDPYMRVMPNPATTSATLQLNSTSTGVHQLRITDMSGRVMGMNTFTGASFSIARNGWAAGTYILHVSNADGSSNSARLILQ